MDLDLTPPSVEASASAIVYDLMDRVTIECRFSDALSGVVASHCPTLGVPAWTLPEAPIAEVAWARDAADHLSLTEVSIRVAPTGSGLCALARYFSSTAKDGDASEE